jgi:hypothetical protein
LLTGVQSQSTDGPPSAFNPNHLATRIHAHIKHKPFFDQLTITF